MVSVGRGEGQYSGGQWEVQTVVCKIGSRIYCTTWGTEPIFCNNRKWSVTFKNCIKIYMEEKQVNKKIQIFGV